MKNTPEYKLNQRIQDILIVLADGGEFAEQVEQLLKVLGYTSERKPQGKEGNIREIVNAKTDKTKADQLLIDESLVAEVIFQITGEEIQEVQQGNFLEEGESFNGGDSDSFIFSFAELKGDNYNRTDLANMTRAMNGVYTGTPSVVLFRYADKLSVGLIGRRPHKRQEERDVLLKVSLIKDIDLKNPHRAHVDILTELSLAHRLRWMESERVSKDFDGLLKAWLTTLDIKELNKRFYRELSDWFKWAKKETRFPAEEKTGLKQEEHIMRLLVRILFVWFIKEKGLVAEQLFNPPDIKGLLKEFNTTTESDSYYRAILQNLFFATLNTEIKKRAFSSRQQKTHRNFNLYRYKDQMKKPDKLRALFEKTPFINGGLFDCLDDFEATGSGGRRIDCFSDNKSVWDQVAVPDRLFFARVNSTKGLIELFKSYKFTVEENTPIEQDVALDPELLGQVFEELLDEVKSDDNDKNRSNRKDTGSYYTRREVVDYMVNEALITRLSRLGIAEDKLDYLLDYASDYDDAGEFFKDDKGKEARKLVNSIARLKILDPAVGSGAFPMGVLSKLNLALHRLDPDNEIWKSVQIELATEKTRKTFAGETDESTREDQLATINHNFEIHKGSDFGRKLYLIQNCIFGVDVQPIACQIAKLRFFISLAIEQNPSNDQTDNYGIQPLPNLETRFVPADALIAQKALEPVWIELGKTDSTPAKLEKIIKIQSKLQTNRERHFSVSARQAKLSVRRKNEGLRKQLAEELKLLKLKGVSNEMAERAAKWDPYDQNAYAEWFDPIYMFGVQDGFDIVIGNPPYIQLKESSGKYANKYDKKGYETFIRSGNMYVLFYERGHQLLAHNGYLCYITSHQWLRAEYGKKLRVYLSNNACPLKLTDLRFRVFKAGVDVNILLLGKQPIKGSSLDIFTANRWEDLEVRTKDESISIPKGDSSWLISATKATTTEQLLKDKVEKVGIPIKEWEVNLNLGIITGCNAAFIITGDERREILTGCGSEPERQITKNLIRPLLRGKKVRRYRTDGECEYIIVVPSGWTNCNRGNQNPETFFKSNSPQIYKYLKSFGDAQKPEKKGLYRRPEQGNYWWELRPCRYYAEFEKKKLIWSDIAQNPRFFYDTGGFYALDTTFTMTGPPPKLRYLCGVLNSNLGWYVFRKYYASELGNKGYRYKKRFVERLPIPLVTDVNAHRVNEIETLVDRITTTKINDSNTSTSDWEQKIDELVYQLYGLDDAEIKMVENAVESWREAIKNTSKRKKSK